MYSALSTPSNSPHLNTLPDLMCPSDSVIDRY